MEHHDIDAIKPLILSVVAAATGNIHEMLAVVSLSLSIIYTLYKFYKIKDEE